MKLAIIIPQLVKGGAERVVCNIANYLSNKNEITLISFRGLKCQYVLNSSVNIVYIDNEKDRKFFRIIKRRYKLKKILKNSNFDIILCFLPKAAFLTLSLKKSLNSKIIVSVRNDPKIEYKKIINKILMKIYYEKADGFVFQTQEAKEYFNTKIQNKSKIILNSVDPKFLKKTFTGERRKEIVTVGRLTEQKNHSLLINAFKEIHSDYPDYKLIIYGEGNDRKKLQELIKKLKLEKNVLLPGLCNNIENTINKSKVFVLSSLYEGMPNALIEAMSLGLACISTDCPCGGPQMLINTNINGIIVKNNNISELAKALRKILEDDTFAESLSINAAKIQQMINPDIINLEWENYLKEFL